MSHKIDKMILPLIELVTLVACIPLLFDGTIRSVCKLSERSTRGSVGEARDFCCLDQTTEASLKSVAKPDEKVAAFFLLFCHFKSWSTK